MIEIGMITAPRKKPTIDLSMKYLRKAGFQEHVTVFAEPGDYKINYPNYTIKKNKVKLGCFKNYHNALSQVVNTDKDYVLIVADDFIYNKLTYKHVLKAINSMDNYAYLALFTPHGMKHPPCQIRGKGWVKVNMGWGAAFGGIRIMKTEIAKQIITHDYYLNHLENYEKNQQIDHCIPQVCFELGLDQYFHVPSLADHIGKHSTIGHIHSKETRGLNFRI